MSKINFKKKFDDLVSIYPTEKLLNIVMQTKNNKEFIDIINKQLKQ